MDDGVYPDLPFEDYLAEPRLSSSGIKDILVSPLTFWTNSWLNPDRAERNTEPMRIGRAYHARVVEGAEAFHERYAVKPDPADYPDALRTVEDMKAALAERGWPQTGRKDELKSRLQDYLAEIENDNVVFWDDINTPPEGKELLSPDVFKRVEIAAAMIERHPQLSKAFTGGQSELSIMWHDENGIALKARLDYLKPKVIVDLKTFSNPFGKPMERAIVSAMATYRYHIQMAVYDEAVEASTMARVEPLTLLLIFQETATHAARGVILPRNMMFKLGQHQVQEAKDIFKQNMEAFGDDPWVDTTEITVIDDTAWPVWAAE
jgi:hypothetical protein